MEDKELLNHCHAGECICDGCERRFVCWTTKRVFSEPIHQTLYEAYVAEGHSHEDAVKEVEEMIKRAVLEAALRQNKYDKYVPDVKNDWDRGGWNDFPYPKFHKWDCQYGDLAKLPAEEARERIKDMTQYFRSKISG